MTLPAVPALAALLALTVPANPAPATRTLAPVKVFSSQGAVTDPGGLLAQRPTRLAGNGAQVVLDFGKEVGGFVSLRFTGASDPGQQVGLAFSESDLYVGPNSDASTDGPPDGAIYATATGSYTMPPERLRGGFRYLTLFHNGDGWLDIDKVSLEFTAAAGMDQPNAYPNYFSSNDDLLNRIWYAGAYTVQMCTIKPTQGRVWPPPAQGWNNSATVGVGSSILIDGAKRDRTVWAGDLGIAVPTAYVSTNDMVSVRNALTTLFQHQRPSGELPWAGPQVNFYDSDTYHLWTLVGAASYYTYTGDDDWLSSTWSQIKSAMTFSTAKINGSGLMYVTGVNDWARSDQGGENLEANAILYRALTTGADLATAQDEPDVAAHWTQLAEGVRQAVNTLLWDGGSGSYRDNPNSGLHPQDGNSLAVWFGLTTSAEQATLTVNALRANWNSFGSTTPEKGGAIGTFPGSMEVQARFTANDDQNALELIRREWGYMLNSPHGTGSTFWEGFLADGNFDYRGSYQSLSHGWATGPTSALTAFVLGISPGDTVGSYRFQPHIGDLTQAEGRLTLPNGVLTASWTLNRASLEFRQTITAPKGSTGTIGIPTFGRDVAVDVDGRTVWTGKAATTSGVTAADAYINLAGMTDGTHTITSKPAS